ncbi:MAG: hypothetical protein Q9182_004515 [Xanthomendoza sp. 2 TL-2023]
MTPRTSSRATPIVADDSNAPSGNTGKAVFKLLTALPGPGEPSTSTTEEPGEEIPRTGGASASPNKGESPTNDDEINLVRGKVGKTVVKSPTTVSEPGQSGTQSHEDNSVRTSSQPRVIHHRGQNPCTDRKNVQSQNQDHPYHHGAGEASQAAVAKSHKQTYQLMSWHCSPDWA